MIKNLEFSYKDKKIFSDFNISIQQNKFTVLLGNNGSGKTTLCKILDTMLPYNGYITIEKEILSKKNLYFSRIMSIIYDGEINLDTKSIIEIFLCNCYISKKELNQIIKTFSLEKILQKRNYYMNKNEKQLLYILSSVVSDSSILILDEPFSYLNKEQKQKILEYLKKTKKTVLLCTSNIEDTLYADQIIVMDEGNKIIETEIEHLSNYEKKLKKIGFSLPFSIDLSKKLSYYNLLDGTMKNINEMVDNLWK